jgi:hypothetical protein
MRRLFDVLLCVVVLFLGYVVMLQAQGRPDLSEVYVTTQDYAKMRLGPGDNWEVLTTVDFGTTMRATGRSVNSRWIQVAYEGEINPDAPDHATVGDVTYGWIAYWLLIWTGDVLELPVDGVETIRSARQSGPLITVSSTTRYYVDGIDPSTRVTDVIIDTTEVELTGRIAGGSQGYSWLQFEYEGNYYWTATWEVGAPDGFYNLADGASVFPYGRLLTQLQQSTSANSSSLNSIARRWRDLDGGYQTTCNNIPAQARIRDDFFTESDLQKEPSFIPPVTALRASIVNINEAITLFEQVCNREGGGRFATSEDVQEALIYVEEAERQFSIVRLFFTPFASRNPLLGGLANKRGDTR